MKDWNSYIGMKFNMLTVVGILPHSTKNKHSTKFICVCDCGKGTTACACRVRNGGTKSCGCLSRINLIGQKHTQKYEYNINFFKNLTPDSLYILGLFYTDGNLAKEKGKGSIVLQEKDKYLLEKISLLIKNNDKLVYIPSKKCTGIVKGISQPQYRFYFCNQEIYKDLIEYGITPNKSKTLKLDDRLKNSTDFWRGAFDGDGSVKMKTYQSGNKALSLNMCSASLSFISSFKDFCVENTNTKVNIHKLKDRDFYVFNICGKDAIKIYKSLYETKSDLFLERKKKYLKEII